MPGSVLKITRVDSVASPKPDTQRVSAGSMTTSDARRRLGRLHEKLRQIRQGAQPPQVVMLHPPADPEKLADELDLLGAKASTLANELRHGALDDPALVERTMTYLQECYDTLARAVEERPQWSRA